MIYGYARVSTKHQEKDGNSLEAQIEKLKENGAVEIFKDVYSGKKMNRPNFDILVDKLVDGDTLIVTRLDRVARSLSGGARLVNELIEKGVRINILNIGILDNTPSSKLIRNIFFSFAEFEREIIIERTREGKEIAKTKKGFKDGRPKKYTNYQLRSAVVLLEAFGGDKTYSEVVKLTNISKSTLIREVKRLKEIEALNDGGIEK